MRAHRVTGRITHATGARCGSWRVATAALGRRTRRARGKAGITHRARRRARTAPAPGDRRLRLATPARPARRACPRRQTARRPAAGTAPRFGRAPGGTACERGALSRQRPCELARAAGCARVAVQGEQRVQPHALQVRVRHRVLHLHPLCDARRSNAAAVSGGPMHRCAAAAAQQCAAAPAARTEQLRHVEAERTRHHQRRAVRGRHENAQVGRRRRRHGEAACLPVRRAAARRGRAAQRRRERAPEGRAVTLGARAPSSRGRFGCERVHAQADVGAVAVGRTCGRIS